MPSEFLSKKKNTANSKYWVG